MVIHAKSASPLGPVLFVADGPALSGLYFIGQKDCPPLPGLAGLPQRDSSPAAGELDGRPLRNLHVRVRRASQALDLFGDIPRASHSPLQFEGSCGQGSMSELELLDPHAPAQACRLLRQAHQELTEYFSGRRRVFSVPLSLQGTPFQRKVWQALLSIPYGEYASYGQVAQTAGMTAQHGRPVGTAVGQNPISIIVPCHRVLAGGGKLNGYTGGLARKVALLEIEGMEIS